MEENGSSSNSPTVASDATHSFPGIPRSQAASPQAQQRPEFWKNSVAISENQVTHFPATLPTSAAFRTLFTSVYRFSEILNSPMSCLHRECMWIFRHSALSSPGSSEVSSLKYLLLSWEQIWHDSLLFTKTLCSTETRPLCSCYNHGSSHHEKTQRKSTPCQAWHWALTGKEISQELATVFTVDKSHPRWSLKIPSATWVAFLNAHTDTGLKKRHPITHTFS